LSENRRQIKEVIYWWASLSDEPEFRGEDISVAQTLDDVRSTLTDLHTEIASIAQSSPDTSSAAYTTWRSRTRSLLTAALGPNHHITSEFVALSWLPVAFTVGDDGPFIRAFRSAAGQAQGYLDASLYELDAMVARRGELGADDVDDELWEFVEHDVRAEHWGKATTQATLFTEDRIRKWTGQPADLVGKDLVTAVLGDKGDYRLGRTPGEMQGWHMLAMGIAMALRNPAGHRIEDRPDHRRYALGVLGSCSLLLTQLRYEHGNRFHDLSPASAAKPPHDVAPAG